MQITGGKVTFGRSVQPAQYETKKAEVEITFTLAEGEPLGATLDQAAAFAQNKALEMVGLKKPTDAPPPAEKSVVETKQANPETVTKPKPAAKNKADLEKAKAAELEGKKPVEFPKEETPAISTGGERTDPEQAGGNDDELFGAAEPAKTITDADMTGAATRVNAKIKNPAAIKALTAEYVAFPKGCREIPQEKRQEWLDKLEKLKPAS